MSRESFVLTIGIIVFFTPWLGIPFNWKLWILSISGVVLVLLGFSLRRTAYLRNIEIATGERGTDAFVESRTPRKGEVLEDVEEEQSV